MKSDALSVERQSAPRRLPPALFLLFLLLGLLRVTPAAADIALDARIGFGQSASGASHYRPGSWTPITIYLSGQGVRGVGQLTVTVHQGGHAIAYTRKISLHDGPLNDAHNFVFDLRPVNFGMMGQYSAPEVGVQLVVEGRELVKKRFAMPLPVNDETYNILALTRDGSGMNFLARKKLALVHKGVNPSRLANRFGNVVPGNSGYNALEQITSASLLYTDPRALPGMPQGYAMIDAVALADQPLDNLTEDQVSALQTYVRDGGLLVISGGGDLARLKSQFYQEMLPIKALSAAVVRENAPELAALHTRYRHPLDLKDSVALTVGDLQPGAYSLFGPTRGVTGFGLIAARPYGNGTVVFTAFDFLAPEFRGWKQTPSLWRDILLCGNRAVSPRATLSSQAHFGAQNNNRALVDAMAGRQASSAPGFAIVAAFLGMYLFLLVPASYMLLKKLDKRELAWFTAPGLVLGFTVVSYIIALSIKGAALTVNRLVVLEAQANTDQVAGYGQMTIYSPQRAAYDIALGPPGDAGRPYRSAVPAEIFELNEAAIGDLTIEHDQTTKIRGAEVRLWDKRSFDTPVYTSLGGAVEIKTTWLARDQVKVSVRNGTRYTLRECALVNEKGQNVTVGDLAPGETRSAAEPLTWATNNSQSPHLPPAPATWQYANSVNSPRTESPEQTRNSLRYALTQALNNSTTTYPGYPNYNMMNGEEDAQSFGKATNALVGWVDTSGPPLLDVRLNDKPAAGEEVRLLYVHLPPAANLPIEMGRTSNPFFAAPILNLKEEPPAFGIRSPQ